MAEDIIQMSTCRRRRHDVNLEKKNIVSVNHAGPGGSSHNTVLIPMLQRHDMDRKTHFKVIQPIHTSDG